MSASPCACAPCAAHTRSTSSSATSIKRHHGSRRGASVDDALRPRGDAALPPASGRVAPEAGGQPHRHAEEEAMKDGLRFVDSDMHIMEPPDLFDRYLDPKFKHRVTVQVGADGRPKRGAAGL